MTRSPQTADGNRPLSVLVVEDGHEYIENLSRFLGSGFVFRRAGSGREALRMLEDPCDVVFLDMRFDRVPVEALFGDLATVANRFNGDRERARRFLEDNQGLFILARARAAGRRVPVLISHDFSDEPRRWKNLERQHGPVAWLGDNAGPAEIASRLRDLAHGGGAREG